MTDDHQCHQGHTSRWKRTHLLRPCHTQCVAQRCSVLQCVATWEWHLIEGIINSHSATEHAPLAALPVAIRCAVDLVNWARVPVCMQCVTSHTWMGHMWLHPAPHTRRACWQSNAKPCNTPCKTLHHLATHPAKLYTKLQPPRITQQTSMSHVAIARAQLNWIFVHTNIHVQTYYVYVKHAPDEHVASAGAVVELCDTTPTLQHVVDSML